MIAVNLRIFGKVQNVSFRKMVLEQARMLRIKGWIRNTTSINVVEACLQGDRKNVESLVDFIRSSPGKSQVEELKVREVKIKKKYLDFTWL